MDALWKYYQILLQKSFLETPLKTKTMLIDKNENQFIEKNENPKSVSPHYDMMS